MNLAKAQYQSQKQIKLKQSKKLQAVIKHAYKQVPYYKKLLDDHSILPDSIRTIEDLKKIPISTRRDIQQVSKMDIIAKNANLDCCYNYKTGGSTGIPLDIYISQSEMRRRHIIAEAMYFSNGFGIGDKTLRVFEQKYDKPRNLFNKLGVMDRQFFVLDTPKDEIINYMCCWRPDLLISYPATVVELADVFWRNRKEVGFLKGVFTSGEVLTDKARSFIEDVFKTKVYDYYAANECGMIGWQCRAHEGYHINTADVIVETVDNGGNPTTDAGRVIVTTLSAKTMPFIRYDLGDIGKLRQQNCSCGRATAQIDRIKGRALDFIQIPDGWINPWHFTNAIEAFPGVMKYQIVQDSDKAIKIKVVKDDKFNSDSAKAMIDACSSLVKHKLAVNVQIVSDISEDLADKYITVKSRQDKIKGQV